MLHAVFSSIQQKIGYTFRNESLLEEAFTHTTYAHLHGKKDNERLEFLGDAVLQMVATEYLYTRYPQKTEGELTAMRAKAVCADALLFAVDKLKIAKYLLMEGSDENVGKKTYSSLFETVVGAIYTDSGYEEAKAFILRSGVLQRAAEEKDAKTRLQEYVQARKAQAPQYVNEKSGKDNAPIFRCTVHALGESAQGEGGSKKTAEKKAAEALLARLQESDKR